MDDADRRCLAAVHDDLADALSQGPEFLEFRVREIVKVIREYLASLN